MSILNWLTVAFSTATVIISALAIINLSAAEWHWKQADLWASDPDRAEARKANPPWYVRVSRRL